MEFASTPSAATALFAAPRSPGTRAPFNNASPWSSPTASPSVSRNVSPSSLRPGPRRPDPLDGSLPLRWRSLPVANQPPASTTWEEEDLLAQLYEDQLKLKARIQQAEENVRARERQRKQKSIKEYKDADRYRRTRQWPSLGIDPWRHRIQHSLAERKAEEQESESFLQKVASSKPHQYLALPQGLSFFAPQEKPIGAVIV